jgi:hypothetical protein
MTVTTQERNEVSPQDSTTVRQKGSTTERLKITVYPTAEQQHKLKALIIDYWQQHDRLITQNDIIRHLIDRCTVADLEDLEE